MPVTAKSNSTPERRPRKQRVGSSPDSHSSDDLVSSSPGDPSSIGQPSGIIDAPSKIVSISSQASAVSRASAVMRPLRAIANSLASFSMLNVYSVFCWLSYLMFGVGAFLDQEKREYYQDNIGVYFWFLTLVPATFAFFIHAGSYATDLLGFSQDASIMMRRNIYKSTMLLKGLFRGIKLADYVLAQMFGVSDKRVQILFAVILFGPMAAYQAIKSFSPESHYLEPPKECDFTDVEQGVVEFRSNPIMSVEMTDIGPDDAKHDADVIDPISVSQQPKTKTSQRLKAAMIGGSISASMAMVAIGTLLNYFFTNKKQTLLGYGLRFSAGLLFGVIGGVMAGRKFTTVHQVVAWSKQKLEPPLAAADILDTLSRAAIVSVVASNQKGVAVSQLPIEAILTTISTYIVCLAVHAYSQATTNFLWFNRNNLKRRVWCTLMGVESAAFVFLALGATVGQTARVFPSISTDSIAVQVLAPIGFISLSILALFVRTLDVATFIKAKQTQDDRATPSLRS